jgi:hypothetical protein
MPKSKFPLALALLGSVPCAAPAQGGGPGAVVEALRRTFPEEGAALASRLAGQTTEAKRRLTSEALERFQRAHRSAILAAPGARLVALEAWHAALLRELEARDAGLCALLGDRGFFGPEARGAAPPAGLDAYAVALVETAAAGSGRAAPPAPTMEDLEAWLAEAQTRAPGMPLRKILADKAVRAASSRAQVCRGAAALHEAVATLPPDQAARVAPFLVEALVDVGTRPER